MVQIFRVEKRLCRNDLREAAARLRSCNSIYFSFLVVLLSKIFRISSARLYLLRRMSATEQVQPNGAYAENFAGKYNLPPKICGKLSRSLCGNLHSPTKCHVSLVLKKEKKTLNLARAIAARRPVSHSLSTEIPRLF
jgi:hypothetical protein